MSYKVSGSTPAALSLKKIYNMFHISSLLLYKERVGGLEFHLCFWKNGNSEICVWALVPDKLKIFLDYTLLKSSKNNTTSLSAQL